MVLRENLQRRCFQVVLLMQLEMKRGTLDMIIFSLWEMRKLYY